MRQPRGAWPQAGAVKAGMDRARMCSSRLCAEATRRAVLAAVAVIGLVMAQGKAQHLSPLSLGDEKLRKPPVELEDLPQLATD